MQEQKSIFVVKVSKFGPHFLYMLFSYFGQCCSGENRLVFYNYIIATLLLFCFFDDLHLFLIYNYTLLWFYTRFSIGYIVFT